MRKFAFLRFSVGWVIISWQYIPSAFTPIMYHKNLNCIFSDVFDVYLAAYLQSPSSVFTWKKNGKALYRKKVAECENNEGGGGGLLLKERVQIVSAMLLYMVSPFIRISFGHWKIPKIQDITGVILLSSILFKVNKKDRWDSGKSHAPTNSLLWHPD